MLGNSSIGTQIRRKKIKLADWVIQVLVLKLEKKLNLQIG
jgi:hypothetical protein